MGGSGSKDKNDRLLETITDHENCINCMALSEDMSLLVTGSEDTTCRMWSTKTAVTECLGIMKGHTGYVTCVTISDVFVISGSSDFTIRKWDMSTCECLYVYRGHTARIYRLICTGDFIFSTCYDKTAKAWLFDDGDLSDDPDEYSEEEKAEKMCIRTFRGHTLAVYPIIYIPAEDDVVANDDDDDEIVINPLDIIITGSADNTAKSWSFDNCTCIKTFRGHRAAVMCMVTDPTGKTLYTGSADKTIRSWNIMRGECLKVMEGHEAPVICLTVVQRLLYSGSQDGTARCWVREFGDCTRVYRGAKHSIVAIRVQAGILFTASGDTCTRAYDAKSGALKKIFQGHRTGIQCLLIVEHKMYTGGSDRTLRIWNIKDIHREENSMLDDDEPNHNSLPPSKHEQQQQQRLNALENRLNQYDDVDMSSKPSN